MAKLLINVRKVVTLERAGCTVGFYHSHDKPSLPIPSLLYL